jgi:sigma-B regulation protein RsbU (phosphoserine phosphatase)
MAVQPSNLLITQRRKFSLRTLLIVPFVVQIFGTVGLVGYLSFRNGQQAVNELASQLRDELTARIQQQLQSYVETPFLINQINATSLSRGDLQIAALKGSYLFWQQAKTFPTTNLIYCGSEPDGAFMGVGRSNQDRQLELQVSNTSTNYYFNYHRLDDNGDQITIQRRGDRQYDPRVRPWYKAAIAAKQATWSEIYIDFDALVPVITASVPVYDINQQTLLGVCATDFLLSVELDSFLSQLEVGKTGETFIIERSGVLVSSSTSTEEQLVVSTGEQIERLQATESTNPLVQATAQYLMQSFKNDLTPIQTKQEFTFWLNGKRQFLQVVPFRDNRGLDWLIAVVIPEADFMEQIHTNTRYTVLLCVAALAIATTIGVLTARWVTRPILDLNAAAREIAQGRWDTTVSIAHRDEIGELSQSFNQMAQQLQASFVALEDANKVLETRVDERTVELKAANEEISLLNARLKQENLRMSAELDVARKLQKMILPREHELAQISGLEIAGFMEAANEVGGDYYDVLQGRDRLRIGIGDVTGHGLESGVLMIMVQTAVRTLLAIDERDPIKVFGALNQVIYHNTRRMDSTKNLTLALLDYQDGHLSLSGQHEEVIIVRSNGEVEQIDTIDLGFPLGIVDNIADFVAQQHIQLNSGDVAVLYTDGITEATNTQREFYGLERLIRVIQQTGQQSVYDIRQAVIEDLMNHIGTQRVFDDITLLVLKQK